jgi:monoamine oxidase
MPASTRTDVVIIGAGAAGLSAASMLNAAGCDTIIVEARDRLGGRILTEHAEGLRVPIELGAEFIHGEAPETRKLGREHGLAVLDVAGVTLMAQRGRLSPAPDVGQRLADVFNRLRSNRRVDRSFAEALDAMASAPAADRALARQFVEGFEAADANDISERALADDFHGEGPRMMRAAKLFHGYQSLVDALAGRVRDRVRLGVTVRVVRWQKGHVIIESEDRSGAPLPEIAARAAIVTVPVGVLHASPDAAGAIAFEPPVDAVMRAAASMAMGPVVKLVLRLDDAFTDDRFAHRDGKPTAFVLSRSRRPFITWWTSHPVRSPLLVAWSGGGPSRELAGLSADRLEATAVESLAHMLSLKPKSVRADLVSSFYHDWLNDPFSRGAYSYPRVGGFRASSRLAAPVARTLWFAGEATATGEGGGTVEGAISSGLRAARGVARVLT